MIVIGDVHGCYKTLLELIKKLPKNEEIVFTGDLIDRGPSSCDVVQYVIDNKHKCVLGNHEAMSFIPRYLECWAMNGATQTINSYNENYGTILKNEKFLKHVEFFKSLPVYIMFDEVKNSSGDSLVVSHSSIASVWDNKNKTIKKNCEEIVIWDRDYQPEKIDGIFNIFGHTPLKEVKGFESSLFIDTGCVFGNKLTAVRFPQMEIYSQEFIDGELFEV